MPCPWVSLVEGQRRTNGRTRMREGSGPDLIAVDSSNRRKTHEPDFLAGLCTSPHGLNPFEALHRVSPRSLTHNEGVRAAGGTSQLVDT
jgi:hypothetical protein